MYSAKQDQGYAAQNNVRRAIRSSGFPSVLETAEIDRVDGKRHDVISVFTLVLFDSVDTYSNTHIN